MHEFIRRNLDTTLFIFTGQPPHRSGFRKDAERLLSSALLTRERKVTSATTKSGPPYCTEEDLLPSTSMLSVSRPVERTPLPPGYRHGISTPVTSGLKLFCDSSRLQPDTPVRPEGYPLPPMSGSPPLPSTAAHKGHAGGNAAAFTARFEGTHAKWPTEQLHVDRTAVRDRPHGFLPLSRSYPQETPSRTTHIRRLSENVLPSVSRYETQDSRGMFPIPPRHSPSNPHGQHGTPTPVRGLSQDPNSTLPRVTSPKSQRKAKGHVASACLPCKRAHLRLVLCLYRCFHLYMYTN